MNMGCAKNNSSVRAALYHRTCEWRQYYTLLYHEHVQLEGDGYGGRTYDVEIYDVGPSATGANLWTHAGLTHVNTVHTEPRILDP